MITLMLINRYCHQDSPRYCASKMSKDNLNKESSDKILVGTDIIKKRFCIFVAVTDMILFYPMIQQRLLEQC